MRHRTGTLTVTIPLYADTHRLEVAAPLYALDADVRRGRIDLDRSDEAVISVGGIVAGAWEVTIFNPEEI